MTPRRKRMLAVGGILAGVVLAAALTFSALQENMLYFQMPSDFAAGNVPVDRKLRLGGLVKEGSIARQDGELAMEFAVTDNDADITVVYEGVLPDLFREGQGVIAIGYLQQDGRFRAEEVLAKHDENYMPPEVAEALAAKGHPVDAGKN